MKQSPFYIKPVVYPDTVTAEAVLITVLLIVASAELNTVT
jgi:hypothetical protein